MADRNQSQGSYGEQQESQRRPEDSWQSGRNQGGAQGDQNHPGWQSGAQRSQSDYASQGSGNWQGGSGS